MVTVVEDGVEQIVICFMAEISNNTSIYQQEQAQCADFRQVGSGRDLNTGWLPKFNGYIPVQRYISDKILINIRSAFPDISAKLWKKCLIM